jgi:hypothetical protein
MDTFDIMWKFNDFMPLKVATITLAWMTITGFILLIKWHASKY